MIGFDYTIGPPIEVLPPAKKRSNKGQQDWSGAYRAADRAPGFWVEVDCKTRSAARNLAAVSRRRHEYTSVLDGQCVYLKRVPE